MFPNLIILYWGWVFLALDFSSALGGLGLLKASFTSKDQVHLFFIKALYTSVFFISFVTISPALFSRGTIFLLGSISLSCIYNLIICWLLWCNWWKLFPVKVPRNVIRAGRWMKHYWFFSASLDFIYSLHTTLHLFVFMKCDFAHKYLMYI